MKIAQIAALVAIAAAMARADSTPPAAKAPPAASRSKLQMVSVATTPGKPMQLAVPSGPAEQIIVVRDKGEVRLSVMRTVGEIEGGVATLTEKEWAEIERTIAEHHLLAWQPKPTHQTAFDYPTTQFTVVGNPLPANAQTWSEPVEGLEHPLALIHLLGRLAHEKVKSPELHYLTP